MMAAFPRVRSAGALACLLLVCTLLHAAPVHAQTAPTSPSVSCQSGVSEGGIVVSFPVAPSTGGSPILYYTITYTGDGGGTYVMSATTVADNGGVPPPVQLGGTTPLKAGSTYAVSVTATNIVGVSSAGGSSRNCIAASKPGMPLSPSVAIDTSGTGLASLSWSPPPSSQFGGALQLSYTVELRNASGYTLSTQSSMSSPATLFATALPAGTYNATVASVSSAGTSGVAWASFTIVTAGTATSPTSPQSVQWKTLSDAVQVSFTLPQFDGGRPLLRYDLDVFDGTLTSTVSGLASPIQTGALSAGTAYTFTLKAVNSIGSSAGVSTVATFSPTALSAPDAPIIGPVEYDATSTARARITWTSSTLGLSGFIVYYSVGSGTGAALGTTSVSVSSASTSVWLDGFCSGTYSAYVVAVSSSGVTSIPSGVVSFTTSSVAPTVPTEIKPIPVDGGLIVVFAPPSGLGSTPSSYQLYWFTNGPQNAGPHNQNGLSPISTGSASGLQNKVSQTFTLWGSACSVLGASQNFDATPGTATVVPAPVSVNLNTTSYSIGNNQVILPFEVVSSAPVTYVALFIQQAGASSPYYHSVMTWDSSGTAAATLANRFVVSDVVNGVVYSFYLQVRTEGGSLKSNTLNNVMPYVAPSAPRNLTCTPGPVEVDSVTCSWLAPLDLGGLDISETGAVPPYHITYNYPTGTALTINVPCCSYVFRGLLPSTLYNFSATVSTTHTNPDVLATSVSTAVVTSYAAKVPVAPTIQCIDSANQIILYIEYSSDTGYLPLLSSLVSTNVNGVSTLSPLGLNTTKVYSGITNGAIYKFSVTASNAAGSSATSNTRTCTASTLPNCVQSLTVTPGPSALGAMYVSWAAPSSDGGASITQYFLTWTGPTSGSMNVTAPRFTNASITGLVPNGIYTVQVQARNLRGLSTVCPLGGVGGQAAGGPDAPVIVSVTAADSSLGITVTAPTQTGGVALKGYNCTLTPQSGSSPVQTLVVLASQSQPFTQGSLVNGVVYSVVCSVTNVLNATSAWSNSMTGIPASLPDTPTNITLASGAGLGQITVNWTAPLYTGGVAVTLTNFLVRWQLVASPFTSASEQRPASSLNWIIEGLTPGAEYTITVFAQNSVGTSIAVQTGVNSGIAMAANVPCAPASATNTAGDKSALVSWTAATCTGGLPVQFYYVSATDTSSLVIRWMSTSSSSPFSLTMTGLVNGASYTVRVYAANAVGNSTATIATVTPVQPVALPSAPILTGTVAGNMTLTLTSTLSTPTDLGGRSLLSYTCQAVAGTGPVTFPAVGQTVTFIATPYILSGLTNGVNYSVSCAAITSYGTGPWAGVVYGRPATIPNPPTGLSSAGAVVSGPLLGQITLNWVAPVDNGGAPLTGFVVSYTIGGVTQTQSAAVSASSAVLSGLTPNATYFLSVQAQNSEGLSIISTASGFSHTAFGLAAGVPCPPVNVRGIRGSGALTIVWDVPYCNGGLALTDYFVFVKLISDGVNEVTNGAQQVVRSSAASALSVTVSGLMNSYIYSLGVSAANPVGNSTIAYGASLAPAAVPGQIVLLHCSSGPTEEGTFTLGWSSTPSGGDSSNLKFNFTVTEIGGTGASRLVPCGDFSCVARGFTPRVNYSVTGVAINSVGAGQPTSPIICAAAARPDTISPITCRGIDSAVELTYAVSYSTVPAITYEAWVVASGSGNQPALSLSPASPSSTRITSVGGLTNNVPYSIFVRTCSTVGCSANSSTVTCTPGTPPSVPQNVVCTPENTGVRISYTAPATGSPVTYYAAVSSSTQRQVLSSSLLIDVTGLPLDMYQSFAVSAMNDYGSSANVSVSCTTLALRAPDNTLAFRDPATIAPAVSCAVWFTPWPQNPSSASFATSFAVQYWEHNQGSAAPGQFSEVVGTAIPIIVTGLATEKTYIMQVRARSGTAESDATLTFTCATANTVFDPTAIPSAPTVRSSPGATTAALSIARPASSGSLPIHRYWCYTSGQGVPVSTDSVDTDVTFKLVSGLTSGLQYYHYCMADNLPSGAVAVMPYSIPSPIVSEVLRANYTVPTAPTAASLRITPGNAQISFDVLAAAGNPSGSPLLGYAVRWPAPSPGSPTPVTGGSSTYTTNLASIPHLVASGNLINGIKVNFTVEALNGAGFSLPLYTPPVAPGILPGPPTNIVASPRNQSLDVFFQHPSAADSGTNTVTGFVVYYRDVPLANTMPPVSAAQAPIGLTGLTNFLLSNFSICSVSSVSDVRPEAAPLWISSPSSCARFSATPYPRPLPSLDGTLLFARPVAQLPTNGIQGMDDLCLERMSFSRAFLCDEGSLRTPGSVMTYSPSTKPVYVFNAFAWPSARYARVADSPLALLTSGLQTIGAGYAVNFTSFFDETAPVGATGLGSMSSNLATGAAFTGCTDTGAILSGHTCTNWTSRSGPVSTGKDFGLSLASEYARSWLEDGIGSTCGATDKFMYCVWQPSASDGVMNGDETGVDCGGTTRLFDGGESFPCVVPPPQLVCPTSWNISSLTGTKPALGSLTFPNITVHSVIRYTLGYSYLGLNPGGVAEALPGDHLDLALSPWMLGITLTDGKGQQANCSVKVFVIDVEPPQISCFASVQVRSTDPGQNYASGIVWPPPVSMWDNVDVVSISVPPPATRYPAGTNTVTMSASDAAGNVGYCSFQLNVGDLEPPVFTYCPADFEHPLDAGQIYATLTYPQPVAVDNVALDPLFPLGYLGSGPAVGTRVYVPLDSGETEVAVTWIYRDANGNTASCNFTITVADQEVPDLACPADQTVATDPLANTAVLQLQTATPTDNVNLTGVDTRPQFAVGRSLVQLSARDVRGNIATCSYAVTVLDQESPVVTCPADVQWTHPTGVSIAPVYWTAPTARDNVGVVSLTSTLSSGDYLPVASLTTVVYTAKDAANNTGSCSFRVRVESSINPPTPATVGLGDPFLLCPLDIVRVATFASSPPSAAASWPPPSLTNTFLVATLGGSALTRNSTLFTVGVHTLEYTLRDAQNAGVSCTFRVSVLLPTVEPDLHQSARAQLTFNFITVDVALLERAVTTELSRALGVSTTRITVVAVVTAFNRTDVVVEFTPRAETYYDNVLLSGTTRSARVDSPNTPRRNLLAIVVTDDSEALELVAALEEQLNDASSPLATGIFGSSLRPASFVNCSDADSAPWVERATGCMPNSTTLYAGIGFQCPAGCVPASTCNRGLLLDDADSAFQRQWRAVVITSAVWLLLLLLLALAHWCGWLACTRHTNAGLAGRKAPPTVPWPSVRDTSFRPFAAHDDEDVGIDRTYAEGS